MVSLLNAAEHRIKIDLFSGSWVKSVHCYTTSSEEKEIVGDSEDCVNVSKIHTHRGVQWFMVHKTRVICSKQILGVASHWEWATSWIHQQIRGETGDTLKCHYTVYRERVQLSAPQGQRISAIYQHKASDGFISDLRMSVTGNWNKAVWQIFLYLVIWQSTVQDWNHREGINNLKAQSSKST